MAPGDTTVGSRPCRLARRLAEERARPNQVSGASRTFVVADNHRVVSYYALASGAITVQSSVGRFRRNMPDPIPVAVTLRVAHAADTIGIRGIVVHAISEQAKAFYLALGFDASPSDSERPHFLLSNASNSTPESTGHKWPPR
jgi:hypothetical protein